MKLSELKTGERAYIVKVSGHGGFRKRIIEMGFIKGQPVEALLNAPLQDPVKYKLMGYEVSLRHDEAKLIEVADTPPSRLSPSRPTPNLARPQQRSSASVTQDGLTFSQPVDTFATRKGGESLRTVGKTFKI